MFPVPIRLPAVLIACLLLAVPLAARAGTVSVAVAANFAEPAREIAAAFKHDTRHDAVLSFGASGVFYTQMANGAPFEVFLSADADRPARAEADGLAVPKTRFTYAIGRLVLYSAKPGLVDANGAVLKKGNFAKIAIADPALAPYGGAAMDVMNRMGVAKSLAPKVVKGTSITQTYQFIATGAANLGFIAQSQVIAVPGGSRWLVPARLHAPIRQQAVLLRTGARNPAAIAFLRYLKSTRARAIIKRFGYAVGQ